MQRGPDRRLDSLMDPTPPVAAPLRPVDEVPLPRGCSLALSAGTERFPGGLIVGGSPFRAMRLNDPAREALDDLLEHGVRSDDTQVGPFARRLVAAGMLTPSWPSPPRDREQAVTLVVPVKDRPDQLAALLASLGTLRIIVVDDGSTDAARVEEVTQRYGARLIRLDESQGPSAARNAGMREVDTELTCFVDSDCVLIGSWLAPLLAHFSDPMVAAVAPRIVGAQGAGLLAAFERAAGPLDLGPTAALVRPTSTVSFVPAACLLVRTDLGPELFDEALRCGEDVDLVWRLNDAGWLIRYEPSSIISHPARGSLDAWLVQRWSYGTSAAELERRHGEAVAPLGGSLVTLVGWMLVILGLPGVALGLFGLDGIRLARRLRALTTAPARTSWSLTTAATRAGGPILARQVLRSYAPLLLVGLASRRGRRAAAVIVTTAWLGRWLKSDRQLNPALFAALSTLDDLSYCAGLWRGVIRTRRSGALRPRIVHASSFIRGSTATNPREVSQR